MMGAHPEAARRDTGGRAGLPALATRLGRLFAGWVIACMVVVYLANTYATESAAAPIVSLLDTATLLLPIPMLIGAALLHRLGPDPPLRQLVLWLLVIAAPLNIAAGLVVLPEIVHSADHFPLFPGVGTGAWRLSPRVVETAILGALPSGFMVVHFLLQKRAVGALAAQTAAARAESREAQLARQLTEARLVSLQAQIEPHFLYNTLANVQHLVGVDAPAAGRMLTHLIDYLKAALPKMRAGGSTLGQEVALSASYLQIARIRLGDRLTVEVDLPEALRSFPFPPTVVQTLVENAVKHGVERKPGPARIRISASEAGADIQVKVTDDGAGFGSCSGTGVGLRNLRERLRLLYGDAASLSLLPNQPSGITACVTVPKSPAAKA